VLCEQWRTICDELAHHGLPGPGESSDLLPLMRRVSPPSNGSCTCWACSCSCRRFCRVQETEHLSHYLISASGCGKWCWMMSAYLPGEMGRWRACRESMCFCLVEDSTVPKAAYHQQNPEWVQGSGRAFASTVQKNIKSCSTLVWDAHACTFMGMPSYFLKSITFMNFFSVQK